MGLNRLCRAYLCFAVLAHFITAGAISAQSALPTQYPFRVDFNSLRRSVVFIHKVDSTGRVQHFGTGFLLSLPSKSQPNREYRVLVTARHMVDPSWLHCPGQDENIVVVFNKAGYDPKSGEPGTIEKPFVGFWHYPHDDSVDIAVGVFGNDSYPSTGIDNDGFPVFELPSPQELSKVGTGSLVVSAGLLQGASGAKHNYPIFKFGYVSSIIDEKVGVNCCPDPGCDSRLETTWMIAASLVGGNSGSPIIYSPPPFDANQREFLLGIESMSFTPSDVAGMAPVQYLIDMLPDLGLPDIDLSSIGKAQPGPHSTQATLP